VLWRSEFANVLWKYVKHRGMPTATALAALAQARDLMLDHEYELGLDDVLLLAIDSGCTTYDCEYVALAKRLGLRLATRNQQLLLTFPGLTFLPQ
jgi:predicted nucleic acid-binding protein